MGTLMSYFAILLEKLKTAHQEPYGKIQSVFDEKNLFEDLDPITIASIFEVAALSRSPKKQKLLITSSEEISEVGSFLLKLRIKSQGPSVRVQKERFDFIFTFVGFTACQDPDTDKRYNSFPVGHILQKNILLLPFSRRRKQVL